MEVIYPPLKRVAHLELRRDTGIIIGTDDGANIEIKENVGEENIFIFGAKCHEIADATRRMIEVKMYSLHRKAHAKYSWIREPLGTTVSSMS